MSVNAYLMKKTIKKEVKTTVASAMDQVLQILEIKKPSKKTMRAISKVSKKIKGDLKKQLKKTVGKISKSENGRSPIKTRSQAPSVEK